MLQRIATLEGCSLVATDGEVGKVEELYFDDARWVVRYLVVATGGWLTGREVLISPYAVTLVDMVARTVAVDLTRDKVRHSPGISTDEPVSRQYEEKYSRYYGYPMYWPFPTYWRGGAIPTIAQPIGQPTAAERRETKEYGRHEAKAHRDSHLRSSSEVAGYRLQAANGSIGHVEDLLFDDETWAIRYLVIDTKNWLPGRRVLVSPEMIRAVDWAQGTVKVAGSCDQIKQAPAFDPRHLPPGDYELALLSPSRTHQGGM